MGNPSSQGRRERRQERLERKRAAVSHAARYPAERPPPRTIWEALSRLGVEREDLKGVGVLDLGDLKDLAPRLLDFLEPYRELLGWRSRESLFDMFVEGLVSDIERKSVEPIAVAHQQQRHRLQHFVGRSDWNEQPLLAHLRKDVALQLGEPNGVLIVDGSATPKKGTESVGVARQWCGRLGKVENCQVGVHLAYAGRGSCTLIDRRLYMPREWAKDLGRRTKAHVPAEVKFKKAWELADEMLRLDREALPHAWVLGDDEFGRPAQFRDRLAARGERYLLEVPSNITVRKVRREGAGRPPTWHKVTDFVKRLPVSAWSCFKVRDGDKGPVEVRAVVRQVETKRRRGGPRREVLLVMETLDGSQRWLFLSNASSQIPVATFVEVAGKRHFIEEAFQLGKGEVGLDHYEVRSWRGWHHHTACAFIAAWFLVREQRRLGKKSIAPHLRTRAALGLRGPVAATRTAAECRPMPVLARPQRSGAHRPLPSEGARSATEERAT